MRGKIRFTKMCLSMIMILALFGSSVSVSAYTNSAQSFSLNDKSIYSGKIIPSETATAAFSDEIDYDSLADLQFQRTISIYGDDISVNLSLLSGTSEVQLNYEGELYKSFRYTDEKPVYIGVFENESTAIQQELGQMDLAVGLEIIYFEISNDDSPYNLDQDLRDTSSITMYLRSEAGTIYDLGSELESPMVLEGIEEQAPSDKDLNWFLSFLEGTYEEEQNYSPLSTRSDIWAGELHSLNFQIADYEHKYLATPYIDFSYGDVPSNGEKKFSMSLKISESHRYKSVNATSWTQDNGNYTRCFWIDNVQMVWTAGGNTEISYVIPSLNTASQGDGSFNFTGLAAAVTGIFPQTATLSSILSAADAVLGLNTGTSKSFVNTATVSLTNTRVHKLRFPASYSIMESGYGLYEDEAERFGYMAFMATKNSSLSKNYWTYAVADFTFDLNWTDLTGGQSGSKKYEEYKTLGYYNNAT